MEEKGILLFQDRKRNSCAGRRSKGDGFPSLSRQSTLPDSPSLNDLSDDVILHTLSFVASVQSLASFAFASKRASRLVFYSSVSDMLFETSYRRAFGYNGTCLKGGKEQWKSLSRLRECLRRTEPLKHRLEDTPRTLGIIPAFEESEAIFYDNPSYGSEDVTSTGYFGLHALSECGPLMVWGDFNGVRIAPSLDMVLARSCSMEQPKLEPSEAREPPSNETMFQAVGDDGGGFQVLTVIQSPRPSECDAAFFLGFASGMITAVSATLSPEGKNNVYKTTSSASVHTSEVTGLAFVSIGGICLLSCSVDGKVYVYPRSGTGSLDDATLACSHSKAIFSVSTARWTDSDALLCTGNPEGKLSLWHGVMASNEIGLSHRFHKCDGDYSSSSSFGENVLVTQLSFVQNDCMILISASNTGELRSWDVSWEKVDLALGETDCEPRLTLRHGMGVAHRGTIESIRAVGNVLITSGGSDGHIKGWDIRTGCLLGSVDVHPGRSFQPGLRSSCVTLRSAVVDTLLCNHRDSIMCLCRDGVVREWSYRRSHPGRVPKHDICSQRSWREKGGVGIHEDLGERKSPLVNSSVLMARRKRQMMQDIGQLMSRPEEDLDLDRNGVSLAAKMRSTIVYAAFRHSVAMPNISCIPCPFIGADNLVYGDIQAAFDRFCGILTCQQCRSVGIDAYVCRLRLKHNESDGENPEPNGIASLLKMLMRPSAAVLSQNQEIRRITSPSSRRINVKLSSNSFATKPSPLLAVLPSTTCSEEVSEPVARGANKIWVCYKCSYENPYMKYNCMGCGRRSGGPVMLVSALNQANVTLKELGAEFVDAGANFNEIRPALSMKDIAAPLPNDVLFGRAQSHHKGNAKFRSLVSHQQVYYLGATREERITISNGIVLAIRSQLPPGRFLKRNKLSGLWHDVGDSKAAVKTSKCLWEVRRKTAKRDVKSCVAFASEESEDLACNRCSELKAAESALCEACSARRNKKKLRRR